MIAVLGLVIGVVVGLLVAPELVLLSPLACNRRTSSASWVCWVRMPFSRVLA